MDKMLKLETGPKNENFRLPYSIDIFLPLFYKQVIDKRLSG